MADIIMDLMTLLLPYSGYAYSVAIIIGAFIASRIAGFLIGRFEKIIALKTKSKVDDILAAAAKGPVKAGILFVGVFFALGFMPGMVQYAQNISMLFTIIFGFYAAYFASKMVGAFIDWYSIEVAAKTSSKLDDQFLPIIKKASFGIIFGIMLLVMLSQLGIEITTLIAAMGIGGLAVALALQPTLSNFFSGVHMILDSPLKIGDYVELDSETKGTVIDIGWRSTRIRTYTNNIVTIPNSKIADSKITNYNTPNTDIGFTVECGVSYGSDLDKVEKVALKTAADVLKKCNGVDGFEPIFRFKEFGDSSIKFKVVLRTKSLGDMYLAKHEYIKALKRNFDKAGIKIPFPQLDIHSDKN